MELDIKSNIVDKSKSYIRTSIQPMIERSAIKKSDLLKKQVLSSKLVKAKEISKDKH